MRDPRALLAGLACLVAIHGCSTAHAPEAPAIGAAGTSAAAPPAVESGFLTDYSRLKPTAEFPSLLVYRDDSLKTGFRKLSFRPVEVWRGADERLEDIPEIDLQYLADSFYKAVVKRIGKSFELVDKPSPGTLDIQIALTLVTRPHQRVDFFSANVPVPPLPARSATMNDATRTFIRDCALEVEFSEVGPKPAKTADQRHRKSRQIMRAAIFDRRRGSETPKGDVRDWNDVDHVFDRWAENLDDQLTALKKGDEPKKMKVPGVPPPTNAERSH